MFDSATSDGPQKCPFHRHLMVQIFSDSLQNIDTVGNGADNTGNTSIDILRLQIPATLFSLLIRNTILQIHRVHENDVSDNTGNTSNSF